MSSAVIARPRARRRSWWKKVVIPTLVYCIAFGTLLITLFPILWLVLTSIRPAAEIVSSHLSLFPNEPTLQNFVEVFTRYKTTNYLINSLIVSVGVVLTNLIIGPPAAYAMSRYTFPGEAIILGVIIFFRMIPLVTALVPLFIIFSWFGLLNTYAALIIAQTAFKLPVTIWLLRSFFMGLSKELDDSARVDGCSTVGAMFRIAIPLIQPGLAASAVLAFLWTWNDLIVTLILSTGPQTETLPLGLSKFVLEYGVDWGPMSAAGVLMFIPVLLFVFVAERYLVQGLAVGGVKE